MLRIKEKKREYNYIKIIFKKPFGIGIWAEG